MNPVSEFGLTAEKICGESVVTISGQGRRQKQIEKTGLYVPCSPAEYEEVTLKWIPYYTWANRGEGEMQVWTREIL